MPSMNPPRPSFCLLVVADDLGGSPGVNRAIAKAFREGGLTHASLLVNAPYLRDALDHVIRPLPDLGIGLHLNLTSGKPAAGAATVPSLVGDDGRFRHGFVGLWRACGRRNQNELYGQIYTEVEAQIQQARSLGIRLTHVDGHRHVHTIPLVYTAVKALAEKYGISRIRAINESLWWTVKTTRSLAPLFSANFVKYLLLKHLCRINGQQHGVYFFSILYSCRLTQRLLERAAPPPGFDTMEIMLHPGGPEVDRNLSWEDPVYRAHLLSPFRTEELQACLSLGKKTARP